MTSAGGPEGLTVSIHEGLDKIAAADWDRLGGDRDPFLSHAFLHALETTGCLQPFGWFPRHVVVRDAAGRLIAALPLYAKTNSYGEFVFDWAWAGAYERLGLPYYPKLVSGIPYTPATGARLLVVPEARADRRRLGDLLIRHAIAQARAHELSGVHWLFTDDKDTAQLAGHGLMRRMGCQYHWSNQGYADFEDFLGALNASKRKKIRRERRRVFEQGIQIALFHGDEVEDAVLDAFHDFYLATFERHMGIPTLSRAFFHQVARGLGRRMLLVMARHGSQWVAGAVNFRSDTTLYGRHWGCREAFHSLHFETCYYQGIDYCIREGLARFEPGAQGEHKISRGFVPTPTWSAHWIKEEAVRPALESFCRHEQQMMRRRCEELMAHSPFRRDGEAIGKQVS